MSTSAAEPPLSAAGAVVVVRLGGERYALPLPDVAEVGRPPATTRVPGVPGWVVGVANWRGSVLAVVDLRPLLATPPGPSRRGGRMVVLARGGTRVGLLVEGVDGTARGDGEPAPVPPLPGPAARLLRGLLRDPAGPVALLDVDAVLALRSTLPGRAA